MTSQEVMSLGERGDVVGMAVQGDKDVPDARNYIAGNYVAEVCENLRPRRGEDMARGQWPPGAICMVRLRA